MADPRNQPPTLLGGLLPRCLGLKHVLSAHDATYVALAECLEAPLLTGDLRLARAARRLGVRCLPE